MPPNAEFIRKNKTDCNRPTLCKLYTANNINATVFYQIFTNKNKRQSLTISNSIELYAAYDDNCLYLAGSVADPEINGDKFQISINIGNVFQSADFNKAIFYTWSLNTDDSVDVLRQESKTDGIIAKVGKGSKTDNSWQFKLAMEWVMLVKDAQLKSGKTVEI